MEPEHIKFRGFDVAPAYIESYLDIVVATASASIQVSTDRGTTWKDVTDTAYAVNTVVSMGGIFFVGDDQSRIWTPGFSD